jgi:hypothetical protein
LGWSHYEAPTGVGRAFPTSRRFATGNDMTDAIISIDPATAVVEKRMIAFSGVVDGDPRKFIMSIADFAHFGVQEAKLDPVGAVAAISPNLSALIEAKARKSELLATTKLAAL